MNPKTIPWWLFCQEWSPASPRKSFFNHQMSFGPRLLSEGIHKTCICVRGRGSHSHLTSLRRSCAPSADHVHCGLRRGRSQGTHHSSLYRVSLDTSRGLVRSLGSDQTCAHPVRKFTSLSLCWFLCKIGRKSACLPR